LTITETRSLAPALVAGLAFIALAGCAKSPETPSAPADATSTAQAPAASEQDLASADQAAALAAKEQELADREAALKQQEVEAELARRRLEADAAQQASAAKAAKKAAAKPAAAKPASTAQVASAQPPAPPPPIIVPAGTPLSIELVAAITTKTAVVGDQVQARLASDLVVGGRRAAPAGTQVSGAVTQVVSGSKKIGGTPMLGITFNSIALAGGPPVAINARYLQQGTSDTGKDTAKVVGTTAAGAIIGHQVSHKNGAVVGGLIGGAAGLAIAQKTGSEVSLPAGTAVSVSLDSAIQIAGN
jgi:hypothetical protein